MVKYWSPKPDDIGSSPSASAKLLFVLELVDKQDLGSCTRNGVRVRLSPKRPNKLIYRNHLLEIISRFDFWYEYKKIIAIYSYLFQDNLVYLQCKKIEM